jgi:hypothetical protein
MNDAACHGRAENYQTRWSDDDGFGMVVRGNKLEYLPGLGAITLWWACVAVIMLPVWRLPFGCDGCY